MLENSIEKEAAVLLSPLVVLEHYEHYKADDAHLQYHYAMHCRRQTLPLMWLTLLVLWDIQQIT